MASADTSHLDSSKIKLPEPRAHATEVRKFLTEALQARGAEIGHSIQLSKKWKTGTGAELRSYSLAMHRQIFGPDPEDVWSVYMAVQPHVIRERQASELPRNQRVLLLILSVFATFAIPVWAFTGTNIGLMIVSFLVGLTGVVVSIYLGVLVFEEHDPIKMVEQDLRARPSNTESKSTQ